MNLWIKACVPFLNTRVFVTALDARKMALSNAPALQAFRIKHRHRNCVISYRFFVRLLPRGRDATDLRACCGGTDGSARTMGTLSDFGVGL